MVRDSAWGSKADRAAPDDDSNVYRMAVTG